MTENDLGYSLYAIWLADAGGENGSPPFGGVLVSSRGWILSEGENTQGATSDCTCHAETNLLHEATRRYSRKLLAHSTMYTSAEPCPMCAGAIFWSGVGRVVFGLSSEHLFALTHKKAEHLFEHCADVLANGTHQVEVCGPMIESEAESVFTHIIESQKAAVN